jgi:tRNA (guanine37-N1)-methyltransferase
VFNGIPVPDVLLSGDHARIARWRREQQIRRTLQRRPDLFDRVCLSEEDQGILDRLRQEAKQEEN